MSTTNSHAGGISRDEFMLRIAASLGQRSDDRPAPPHIPASLIRRVRADAKLINRYCVEAVKAGMTVTRTDQSGAADVIAAALAEQRGENVLLGCMDKSIHALATRAAKQAGALTPAVNMLSRDELFAALASVTDVYAAVAETGSIIMTSHARRARLAHLAPELHIAIVRAEQIVPDLYDLLGDDAFRVAIAQSAYAALVTGPSKTADIEGVLITGVHGPGVVHVIVIE